MRDTLEPSWEYFREALSEAERSFIISEASREEESIDPDLLEEFLFYRDPDSDESELDRAGKDLLYSVAQKSQDRQKDSMAERIMSRNLPGIKSDLVKISGGLMKDTYRGKNEDIIVQIPRSVDSDADTLKTVEQVLTWTHNNRKLKENNIPVATDFEMIISEKNNFPVPATIGEFRRGLVEFSEVTDAEKEMYGDSHGQTNEFLEKNFRKYGIKIADLLLEGEVAYNEPVEDIVNPPFTGIGYHRPTGEIMTYDMGEIGESTFEIIAESDIDSYDEFMERHGIAEDAERLLEDYNH